MTAQRIDKAEARQLMIDALESRDASKITVESPAFSDGSEIPETSSDYGDGRSPELRWSGLPSGTRSVAVVAEDPDASQNTPFTHWLLYNLPAEIRHLPESMPKDSQLPQFDGAMQGRTSAGTIGYYGPHPPASDREHHYHFEVFCLDAPLNVGPGATREQVMNSMAGHVLAKGELTGTYVAPGGR